MNESKENERFTQNGLFISRIPLKTKEEFKCFANEDFAGDYGFCLKFLLDFHQGLLTTSNQVLIDQIEMLAQEIDSIKSSLVKKEEPKKKQIKSVSGRVISEKEE